MINPFNDCVYDNGRWKIYRQDAGMGEHDYCVLRNGEFFCRTEREDTAMLIVHGCETAMDATNKLFERNAKTEVVQAFLAAHKAGTVKFPIQ